jgi:hypothetical protein
LVFLSWGVFEWWRMLNEAAPFEELAPEGQLDMSEEVYEQS